MHGGSSYTSTGASLSDTCVLNLTTQTWNKWESEGAGGAHRAHYGATSYRDRDGAVVFCGRRSSWLGRTGVLITPCYGVEALRLMTDAELDNTSRREGFLGASPRPETTVTLFSICLAVFDGERRCLPLRPIRRDHFNSPIMSDIALRVQGRVFHAHQFVFAEASVVFEKMLTADVAERHQKEIEIADFEASVVETLLRYIYGCLDDDIPSTRVLEVFRVADLYDVFGLRRLCLRIMASDIRLHSLFNYWSLGECYSAEELLVACTDYGRRHASLLMHSTELRSFTRERPFSSYRFLRRLERAVRGQRLFDPRSDASGGLDPSDALQNLDVSSQFPSKIFAKIEILKQAIQLLTSVDP